MARIGHPNTHSFPSSHLRLQQGECDRIPNGRRVRQQHNEPVDAYSQAARRGHTLLQRRQEFLVDTARLLVPRLILGGLSLEPRGWRDRRDRTRSLV